MASTATEIIGSRPATIGRSSSIDLKYKITGCSGDEDAYTTLAAAAPASYRNLVRETVTVDPTEDPTYFLGTVRYVPAANAQRPPLAVGEVGITFDTTGGSQHITQSISTSGSYGQAGDTAPDFHGAIGVTADSIEGCDIISAVFNFTVTKVFAAGSLPSLAIIYGLTGKSNSASFTVTDSQTGLSITLAAGECLFRGASGGGKRGDGSVEVSYSFSGSPNRTAIAVGSVTVTTKKGWEYLWVRYHDVKDTVAKMLVKRPCAAYVEKVYEVGDFGGLGL